MSNSTSQSMILYNHMKKELVNVLIQALNYEFVSLLACKDRSIDEQSCV